MKRSRAAVVLVLSAGLSVACASGPAVAPSAETQRPPTPTPPKGTPAPAATLAPGATLPALRSGLHDAGTYRTKQVDPRVVMTLPQGWSLFFDEPGATYLGIGKGELLVGRAGQIVDPVTRQPAPTPDDVMAWFVSHPELRVTQPTPVEISGHQASWVEIDPTRRVDVFYDPLGNFHVGPGRVARFYVIPWEGSDLFVAVLGSPSGTLEDALAAGVPIVESLQIAQ